MFFRWVCILRVNWTFSNIFQRQKKPSQPPSLPSSWNLISWAHIVQLSDNWTTVQIGGLQADIFLWTFLPADWEASTITVAGSMRTATRMDFKKTNWSTPIAFSYVVQTSQNAVVYYFYGGTMWHLREVPALYTRSSIKHHDYSHPWHFVGQSESAKTLSPMSNMRPYVTHDSCFFVF